VAAEAAPASLAGCPEDIRDLGSARMMSADSSRDGGATIAARNQDPTCGLAVPRSELGFLVLFKDQDADGLASGFEG
jgi:hypothetical protein